jgi:hypothetical protein
MKIVGMDGIDAARVAHEVQRGGKFVIYQYCVSIVIMTFRRPSDVHFVPAGESAVAKGLGYSALSLVLGWWGIPWGPIYTIASLCNNFRGGIDVTNEVVADLQAPGTRAAA